MESEKDDDFDFLEICIRKGCDVNWRGTLITCNNWLVRHCRGTVAREHLLVLLPRCLQHAGCGRDVIENLDECRRCGKCDVAALIGLRDEMAVRISMVGGGREAVRLVRQRDVRAVVACACEKELVEGILASFPRPVLGVTNLTPEGFCRNTGVDIAAMRAAILQIAPQPQKSGA